MPYFYPYNTSLITEINEKRLKAIGIDTLAKFDTISKKYFVATNHPFIIFNLDRYTNDGSFLDIKNECSYITLPSGRIEFDKYGWTFSNTILSGEWGKAGFSIALPQDYLPERYINH